MRIPGLQIAYWRQKKEMSQAELARKAQITQANLSNIESGKRDCTISTLMRIANVLQVQPAQLLSQEKEKSEVAEKIFSSREELEKIVKATVTSKPDLSGEEREIVAQLKSLLPEYAPKRQSLKRSLHAWFSLRQKFDQGQIQTLVERVREFKKLHEETSYRELLQNLKSILGQTR